MTIAAQLLLFTGGALIGYGVAQAIASWRGLVFARSIEGLIAEHDEIVRGLIEQLHDEMPKQHPMGIASFVHPVIEHDDKEEPHD